MGGTYTDISFRKRKDQIETTTASVLKKKERKEKKNHIYAKSMLLHVRRYDLNVISIRLTILVLYPCEWFVSGQKLTKFSKSSSSSYSERIHTSIRKGKEFLVKMRLSVRSKNL